MRLGSEGTAPGTTVKVCEAFALGLHGKRISARRTEPSR